MCDCMLCLCLLLFTFLCLPVIHLGACLCLDYIEAPRSQEDDIHNIQSVIDSLSLDYLQLSLSHITGIINISLLKIRENVYCKYLLFITHMTFTWIHIAHILEEQYIRTQHM